MYHVQKTTNEAVRLVKGPGSQYCGSIYCGSPQLVTRVTATGEVVGSWGVPPKPGHAAWIPRSFSKKKKG